MERNLGKGLMDQQKNHEQIRYNNMEAGNETLESANQRFFHDPSSNINTNIRPPDYSMTAGARPVLNYSIQTGSESGYDISMLNTVEKPCPQVFERKAPSVHEEKSYYDSMRSVSQSSSRNDISQGHQGFVSRNASLSSSTKNMMEECNVLEEGGPQKPRIFLFSSSDLEDAQYGLGSVETDSEMQYVVAVNGMDLGSRKNSIAASASENNLDELLGLNIVREAGRTVSEAAATGSASLTAHAPSSTVQSSHAPSSTLQSSQPVLYSYGSQPSNYVMAGESLVSMPVQGHVTPQVGLADMGFQVQDPEVSIKEVKLKRDSSAPKIAEPEKVRSLDKAPPTKEPKMKRDASLPKISETEKVRISEKEYSVPSNAHDSSVANHIFSEEASVAMSVPDTVSSSFPAKNFKKTQEALQNIVSPEVVTEGRKNVEDDHFYTASGPFTSGAGGSEADPNDFSCLEPSVIPQRVFHSERIPREQAEMNRLSKSDDSFGSQFLMSQAHSDPSQIIREAVDRIHDGNLSPQADQSVQSANPRSKNPRTVMDGLAEFENYKGFADKIISNISEEGLESTKEKSELKQVSVKSTVDEAAVGLNHPTAGQRTSVKHLDDPSLKPSDFERIEKDENKNVGNHTKGHNQPLVWAENPTRAISSVPPAASVCSSEHGDILIDINDRFPRDLLSDIFSKARMSQNLYGISPFSGDGAGLSLNMENHEPKHWSYFRNLAQDEFVRKDVSLMDQDHLGFSSPLTNIEVGAPIDYSYPPLKSAGGVALAQIKPDISFDEDIRQESVSVAATNNLDIGSEYKKSPLEGDESVRAGQSLQVPESEFEDGKLDIQNTGVPLVDHCHGEFDISTLQIIKNEDLEELRELGSGTFGTVYHGKWRGTDVAIKRIKKICFTGRSSEQERLTVEFWREADILSKLHHPNVVAFYGVVQDGPGGTLATVTEFMVNGSLRHVLLSKDRQLDRRKRLIIAMDAAFGMEYLHSKNIVHFDLKCDNLLVNLKDPVRPICKVGDFGLSKIKRNTLVTGGVRGTLPWMAPELLNGSSSKVSEKVDVFSFGIVLWEILTGEEPYANMHYGAIIGGIVSNTLRPPVPSYCDPEWKLLMEQCWAPDPVVRPSFTEIARRLRIMSSACQTKPQGHQMQNQASNVQCS
ncbi:hypothetical protein V6Z11_A12G054300 [Gossypium hirsutum]